MKSAPRSADEPGRLAALAAYDIDACRGLPSLAPIVHMAVRLFDCPAAAVTMVGEDHIFYAASEGMTKCDMTRDSSFCAHAIVEDGVMVVEDAALDPRFHDNPLVAAGSVRFYAGVALKAASGHAFGTLSVMDDKPHPDFSTADRARLRELAGLVLDKLELRRLEVEARARPSHFGASAATSPNAVICFDASRRVTAWNDAASAMLGYTARQIIGHPIEQLVDPADHAVVDAALARVRSGGTPMSEASTLTGIRASGERFPAEIHWSNWIEHGAMHFGAIVRDVTERHREHDLLYRLANFDTLTGLANRNLMQTRIAHALEEGESAALLIIDLGGFRDVNNTLGQAAGDTVLLSMAARLGSLALDDDLLARMGGAMFALWAKARDRAQLDMLAKSVLDLIAEPLVVDGQEVRLIANIGIASAPQDGATGAEVMSSAELALFQARLKGPGHHFHFIPSLRAAAVARRMYDAELHRAFERHQFRIFYQPQIRLADGALTGAEALIRWKHPQRGLLQPAAFVPALESSALAVRVGRWVLGKACAQAAEWLSNDPSFRMGINLFAAQFRSGHLIRDIEEVLAEHSLPPASLELEITENILLDGEEDVIAQLERLRQLGVALSFDDFGTGFASLNLLRTVPVNHIKIDKSFTRLICSNHRDQVIVTSLIDMARRLGINVIAEGVETEEDATFLRTRGCDEAQGYLYGEAVPAAIFADRHFGTKAAATG